MLELRPTCENCHKALPPPYSTEAMICTFECTFCATYVHDILHNVCPNFGGGFVARPIRPKEQLTKHPSSTTVVYKAINTLQFEKLKDKYQGILPDKC